MNDLDIHSLLMAIRGLSNEITVRGLSAQLGISYSTLARCKNGVWPRSITLDAMRGVLDDCRERYFGGSGTALASTLLLQLRGRDIDTRALEGTLAAGGYEAFVSELLMQASSHRGADKSASKSAAPEPPKAPPAEPAPRPQESAPVPAPDRPPEPAQHAGNTPRAARSERIRELRLVLPLAIVLLMGLLNVSLSALFAWAAHNRASFVALSLLVAVLPALAGVLVDAPLAWRAYRRTHPDAPFSPQAFAHVAKYGDAEGVAAGAGRYNLTASYLAYQPVCNLLGALTYLALFFFLLTLSGFEAFFEGHEWTEYLKVGVAVAFAVVYGHMRDQLRRSPAPTGIPTQADAENPDNYLPDRAHVWANNLHLVWSLSLLMVLLLGLLAYSITHARAMPTPALMLWPYLQGMAFFAFSCTSPYAARVQATAVGTYLPGVAITSAGFAALALLCYLPSWGGAALCGACALCTGAAVVWTRARARGEKAAWLAEQHGSWTYSALVGAAVFALLAFGLATAAFA